MKKIVMMSFLMIGAFMLVNAAYSENEPMGKAVIELPAGKKGDITFPHGKHQQTLKDCNLCHSLFPKQEGVVVQMKSEGKLRKKQVMDNCLDCHRARKKAGLETGPTSCSKCHH